jgi:hypothetical protein
MTRKKGMTPPKAEAGRYRKTSEWISSRDEITRLQRFTSNHALRRVTRTGTIGGCSCDMCRFAVTRLGELGAG